MEKIISTLPSPVATVRPVWPLAALFTACSAFGLLAGCTTEPESHLVSAPPPPTTRPATMTTTTVSTTAPQPAAVQAVQLGNTTYVTSPAPVPATSTTIITQSAPPAPQQEVILARPAGYSEQYVWLNGYWTWRNERYEWMAGHWELPPSGASIWSAPRWEQEGNSYRFYEGYWH